MGAPTDTRIDLLLHGRELASSRSEAQRLVNCGSVTVNGEIVTKVSRRFPDDCTIVIAATNGPKYVSRGGLKLSAGLDAFQIDVAGAVCLDIGISTGGFADCLLQAGATHVTGIDVGHGQLHASLANDARIELREGVNARHLTGGDFSTTFSIITVDVSFISLTLIVPRLVPLLARDGRLICQIKPQFEVGVGNLGKNGIVDDPALRQLARENVHREARNAGLEVIGTIDSPIAGGDGNQEYLTCFAHIHE